MVAIITPDFKKKIIQDLFDDVRDSAERYYIGIGRSEDWDSADTPPTPIVTNKEVLNARLTMQSVKSAEDVSFVVPRNNWTSGTIYTAWDDNIAGYPSSAYYVITENNGVYVCLQQGKDASGNVLASTIQPTGASTNAFTTSDGYTWKFLYTLSAVDTSKFLTANFIPVKFITSTDSSSTAIEIEQKGVQDAATIGQISSIKLNANGVGYTSVPAVTINGDGTGASATAMISGGEVVKINMDNDSSAMGSGYTFAEVVLSGGGFTTAATAVPIISPTLGFGADPRDDLKSSGIMFNTQLSGDENGTFVIDNDFRQVTLLKGLKKPNDSDFTAGSGNALRILNFDTVSVAFSADKIIQGATSGAQGYVDKYDDTNTKIFYHQTDDTGFVSFVEGETVNETNGSGTGVLDSAGVDVDSIADSSGDINKFSGKMLYIDNRAAIDRSVDQTEDIKVVIQI